MSIKIGIYEFFAYTIPGIVYLSVGAYLLYVFGRIQINLQTLADWPLSIYALVLLVAYILGLLMDPIAKKVWYDRLFVPRDKLHEGIETVELVYASVLKQFTKPKVHPQYWYSVLIHLHKENPEVASSLERFNASRIMLRNISFILVVSAFFISALNLLSQDYLLAVTSGFTLFVFAIIAGKESAKYHRWFYQGILQAAFVSEVEFPDYLNVIEEKGKPLTPVAVDSGFTAREWGRDVQSE